MRLRLFALATLAAVAVGCSKPPPVAPTASPDSPALAPSASVEAPKAQDWSPEVKAKAEQLLAARKDGKFAYQELSVKGNGPVFVYLVLTSEDPQVIGRALEGLEKTYNPNQEYDGTNKSDARVVEAVLKGLDSEDKFVLHYALKASPDALGKEPSPEVVTKLVEIGNNHPELGARIEAINALYTAEGYDKSREILDLFIKAMGDRPALASTALFRRSFGFAKSEKAEEMRTVAEGLLKNEDPGVRGRAIELTWDFHSGDGEWAVTTYGPMLKDKNPFVRSKAAHVLGLSKDLRAVDLLMPLLDDKEKNTYDIQYQNLLGQTETVHHDGSAWSRVDDAALYSLKSITFNLPESQRFSYDKVDYKNVDGDIAAYVKKAKAWYEQFKKSAPK